MQKDGGIEEDSVSKFVMMYGTEPWKLNISFENKIKVTLFR